MLVAELDAGEPLLARGTGNEARRLSRHVSNGAGAYFIVTPSRLLWSPPRATHRRVSLDFDTVTSWSDGTQYHRYALVLRHAAVERIDWAPAHKILWFEWGDTEVTKEQSRRSSISADLIRRSPRAYATSCSAARSRRVHLSNSTSSPGGTKPRRCHARSPAMEGPFALIIGLSRVRSREMLN